MKILKTIMKIIKTIKINKMLLIQIKCKIKTLSYKITNAKVKKHKKNKAKL